METTRDARTGQPTEVRPVAIRQSSASVDTESPGCSAAGESPAEVQDDCMLVTREGWLYIPSPTYSRSRTDRASVPS
jgi:hypothetical protein